MTDILTAGPGELVYHGYLSAFALGTVVCLWAAWRARQIPYLGTRRGLVAFFLGSGAWAATYVGFLLVSSAPGKHLFYQASLIVGFSVVWAWLWFCSAYSGRGLHRNPAVRRFAAAVFLVVATLKVTNPLHGLYYSLEPSGGAFGLVVSHGTLYWVVMALSYALASAGYLMLFELFLKTEARTGPLAVLTGLTALPAALNVTGHIFPSLLDVTHEPLGVAVFAVGVLLAYTYQFSAVRVAGGLGEPTLMLGADGKIRDCGGGAAEAIPGLNADSAPEADPVGKPLAAVLPGLAEALREGRSVWETSVREASVREPSAGETKEAPEPRYFRLTETSLHGTDGDRVVVLSDITDRKRRERRLGRQNDLFEKAQDLADVGAWEYDVQEGILTWTQQVYAIHGLPEDTRLTPEKAIEHYHREDRSRMEEVFTRAVEDGIPYDEELRIRRPGGEVRWVRAYGEPQTEQGAVVRVRGAFKDITERKRRERRADRLRRKYQTLLEGAPDAIVLADQETGQIVEANQEAAELIGATREEIVGRNQVDLHPGGETGRYQRLFEEVGRRVAQTSEPETVYRFDDGSPTYVQSDDGEKVPVEISATTIELEGRRLTLGIFRDVTKRRRREQALREAKEEAQKASQMKSSLLANMSHEIRTPLTSIIGFSEAIGGELEALGDCPDDADLSRLARFSEMIEEGGTRLLETLDSVLHLSKLEAGQMELAEEAVDLSEEAGALTEELLPQAEESGVDYEVETNGTPVRARADPGGVQIALRNLVSNAIKYTGEGGTVRVRAYQEDGWATLEVEDTGIGMDPQAVEDLFEPFRQASEGWGREYEGTGVGLAVTKKATEQMGGHLEVETEKGEGTCFTMRLPRNEERPHEEA